MEIGSLRGDTTRQIVDRLGPGTELHVIDPVPVFDPADLGLDGRCTVHADLSLNVLPDLPAMDVALIDGDHNWFTVYHELRLLADAARRDGAPLPVLILHDVGWPYGRRDLYYAPERIPEEHRQPHAQRGLRPGRPGVDRGDGGLNATMHNALVEGGERNGVMTALDDFMAECDRPLRRLTTPVYFGLAIVADEERLRTAPALAAVFDRLESPEGKDELLALAESLRIRALLHQRKEIAAARGTRRPRRRSVPAPAEGRPARRALHRERGPAAVPGRLHRQEPPRRRDPAPRPGPAAQAAHRDPGAAPAPPAPPVGADRGPGLVPAVHGHGAGAPRPPRARPRHDPGRAGSRATSSTARPAAGAAASSSAATWLPTRSPTATSGSPTRSGWRVTPPPGCST